MDEYSMKTVGYIASHGGPFDLGDQAASSSYERWREAKLRDYPADGGALMVEINDPGALGPAETGAIHSRLVKANMALYAVTGGGDGSPEKQKKWLIEICRVFGLSRLDANLCSDSDGITHLKVDQSGSRGTYIPYTNRPIGWHTDGYYNSPDRTVRGLALHCVRPAISGGENRLMDHEIAYILLRDRDPAFIRTLSRGDAMTIPANEEEGPDAVRAEQSGPVFSVSPADGSLHMRYSARKRNIRWRDDCATRDAVTALEEILADPGVYGFRYRLSAGQGLISNNALHDRSGFEDGKGPGRLIYRARYYDRVENSGPDTQFKYK